MNIELTNLIVSQLKTIGTMMAAGVVTAATWQLKCLLADSASKRKKRKKAARYLAEIAFWTITAISIPMFLYYCTYGKVTFCAVLGLITGILIWKILINKVFK